MAESLPAVHDDGAWATSVGLVDFSEMVREKKVEAKLDQSSSAFFKSRARRQSYDTDRTFKKFFWRETRLPLGAACTIFMTMQFLSSAPNLVNNCKSLKMSAETPTTVFVVFHLDVWFAILVLQPKWSEYFCKVLFHAMRCDCKQLQHFTTSSNFIQVFFFGWNLPFSFVAFSGKRFNLQSSFYAPRTEPTTSCLRGVRSTTVLPPLLLDQYLTWSRRTFIMRRPLRD